MQRLAILRIESTPHCKSPIHTGHSYLSANRSYPGMNDLGGYAETAALYRLKDTREPQCFADCLASIHHGIRRLRAADALLRDYRESALANKNNASKRFFEECMQHNAHFLMLIEDNLADEQPW